MKNKLTILAAIALTAALISLWGGLAQAGGPWYVAPTGNDANDCLSPATACLTIQAAIGMASSGDTIIVAAGTYAERLTINISLDLRGAQYGVDPTVLGGRAGAESIITEAGLTTPNPDVLIEIPSSTTDVTVDGFTLNGDPSNRTADTSIVRAWDDHIIINNNIMDGARGVLYKGNDGLTVHRNRMVVNKNGVVVQPSLATDVTVSENVFTLGSDPFGDETAIFLSNSTYSSVIGNTATGFINAKGLVGAGGSGHLTVSGNTFTGNKDAVSFWGGATFLTITDNILSNSLRYGINVKGADITIEGNQITDNLDVGINIDMNVIDTERVTISCNNISGNTNFGVRVVTANVTEIINAVNNWWGAADGPSGVGPGSGDEVTAGVDFAPFRTSLPTDTCSVDHFLCYNVAKVPGEQKIESVDEDVILSDQFSETTKRVLKPVKLCVPVDKNGEGITDPDTHLVCYEVEAAEGLPHQNPVDQDVVVTNQFSEEGQVLRVKRPNFLCVPSTKQVIE